MDRLRGWWRRIEAFLWRGRAEAAMEDEVAFHLAMEEEQLEARGLSPAEARRAARLAFGGVDRFKEGVRDARGFRWIDDLGRDVRDAFRTLRHAPGFALAAVLTLGLGIGSAVTVFGVVDAVLVRPLAFPDPQRLVHVWETTPDGADFTTSEPNFVDFAGRNRSFEDLAAYRVDHRSLTGKGEPERLTVLAASHSIFPTLRVAPVLGRAFSADEDRPGGDDVALLGHAFWVRAFGGDSGVLGTTLALDGVPFTVIGVAPDHFPLVDADLWVPLAPHPAGDRGDHWLDLVGRLRPGVTLGQATADLDRVSAEIARIDPAVAGWRTRMVGLTEWAVGPKFRRVGGLLFGAVGFLLLMTCVTVATLMLARGLARRTDLGVRVALGAGRRRVVRQLLVESLVLAALGTGLGLLATGAALAAVRALGVGLVPRLAEVRLDARVLGFALGLTLVTSLLFGLLPAVQSSRVDLRETLGGARAGPPRSHRRIHETLVALQVALAMVLLAGAGLMIRSLVRLGRVDPGFGTDHVWTVPLSLPPARYPSERQTAQGYDRLIGRVRSIPGVVAVGGTSVPPFGDLNLVNDVTPEERATEVRESGYLRAGWRIVTTGYFEAAGIPLLRGRRFTDADHEGQPEVAVITRTLAERLWPGRDPIGRRLYWGAPPGRFGPWSASSATFATSIWRPTHRRFSSSRPTRWSGPI